MTPPAPDDALPNSTEHGDGHEDSTTGWQYDSFYVRLWHASRGERMHRIELRHLQTGLVEAAIDQPLDWILVALRKALVNGYGNES